MNHLIKPCKDKLLDLLDMYRLGVSDGTYIPTNNPLDSETIHSDCADDDLFKSWFQKVYIYSNNKQHMNLFCYRIIKENKDALIYDLEKGTTYQQLTINVMKIIIFFMLLDIGIDRGNDAYDAGCIKHFEKKLSERNYAFDNNKLVLIK